MLASTRVFLVRIWIDKMKRIASGLRYTLEISETVHWELPNAANTLEILESSDKMKLLRV